MAWLRREKIRLVFVNADAECDEALRTVEVAYGRVADENDRLRRVVDAVAASDPMENHAQQDLTFELSCHYCSCWKDSLDDGVANGSDVLIGDHDENCIWRMAVEATT